MSLEHIINIKHVEIENKTLIGIEVNLPGAPLVVIRGKKGFIMCGYLDINTANKLNIVAVKVSGVKTVEDVLEKEVIEASQKAIEIGIKPGMKIKGIIDKIA